MVFYGCLCRSRANLDSSINIKCLLGVLWLYGFYVVLHSFPQLEQVLLMHYNAITQNKLSLTFLTSKEVKK
jgi:hypothetical protein